MKFLALAAMLVLEQIRPLREHEGVEGLLRDYAAFIERHANAGGYRHGVLAWIVFVGSIAAATAILFQLLNAISPLFGLVWSIGVLYIAMGFRRFIDQFTEIQQLLRTGDLAAARECLVRWRGGGSGSGNFEEEDIARAAIEQGLLASHRRVFGIMAWFIVLGPAGAVIYRLADVLEEIWGQPADADRETFGRFATQAFYWVDWIPARLTAAGLAVVGNFEDAVYCWRMQADAWRPRTAGIVLASGAGALGVRLGGTSQGEGGEVRPELGTGAQADVDDMPDAAGLVWKALVLWMFVILVVSVANALG